MAIHKGLFFILFSLFFSVNAFSQILEPVKWNSKVEKISDKEYNLIFTADIDKGWYIYSQFKIEEDGFAPQTFFVFENEGIDYATRPLLLSTGSAIQRLSDMCPNCQ